MAKVIAEIGCNHLGKMDIAKEMILQAKQCGAWSAKFQKRNNKELLTQEQYNSPHPVPENSYGETYGEHREYLEFTQEQHKELMEYCKDVGIVYGCSVWDVTSAKEIAELEPEYIKIGSPTNLNKPVLDTVIESLKGNIHISLGMTTVHEIDKIYEYLDKRSVLWRTVFYHCVSDYPAKFENMNLNRIEFYKEYYNRVCCFGFSGHHLGIAIDIVAAYMGCHYIERHFTLNRTLKGTDHAASLEPEGLRKLIRDLENMKKSLNPHNVDFDSVMECEKFQRNKLKKIDWS